jgi:hypothetical protein
MRNLVIACALASALPLQAHHSHGNYTDTFIDLEGTVKELHLVNPHSWIYIEVVRDERRQGVPGDRAPNGQPQLWALEATNRVSLERIGITRDYVKPGDPVKVRCHPLRDGSRGCLLGFVKARDGSVKDWDGSNLPLPADF